MKYESNNFQFEAEMPWESAGEGIVSKSWVITTT